MLALLLTQMKVKQNCSQVLIVQRMDHPGVLYLMILISLLVERETLDGKVVSTNPSRRIFFSRVKFVC